MAGNGGGQQRRRREQDVPPAEVEMDGRLSLKGHDLHREPMEPLLRQQLVDTADSTVAWRKPLPSPMT